MNIEEVLKQALDALEDFGNHDAACPQWPTYSEPERYPKCNCGYEGSITSLRQAIEVYKQAPPEAQTDAEKTAFAFGWFKALEFQRTNNEIP